MRPVERGPVPQIGVPHTSGVGTVLQNKTFREYALARPDLILRIGDYCSYCERRLTSDLAVEHVEPQNGTPAQAQLALIWTNFLLACRNCNSAKNDKPVTLNGFYWPHLDNTYWAFVYSVSGIVSVRTNGLTQQQIDTATQTMELTNFPGRSDSGPTTADRRLECRRLAWDVAQDSFNDLQSNDCPAMRRQIARTAVAHGYFSVWMTIFDSDSDMKELFIREFRGTAISCFDASKNPISRPGGQI